MAAFPRRLLTVEDVSRMLQLSRLKIYEMKDQIGCFKIGDAVRFRLDDVIAFLERCRVNRKKPRKARCRMKSRHFA